MKETLERIAASLRESATLETATQARIDLYNLNSNDPRIEQAMAQLQNDNSRDSQLAAATTIEQIAAGISTPEPVAASTTTTVDAPAESTPPAPETPAN
jgi:hypothetical protein